MAYLFSNICTKIIVEIIVGGWVVSFFETQCKYEYIIQISEPLN